MTLIYENLNVGITGLPGSGKTTLASQMNNCTVASGDGKNYLLSVNECYEQDACLKEYHIILLVFGLVNDTYFDASQLALRLKQRTPRLCMTGTKLDLLPNTHSDIDLDAQTYRAQFAFEYELPYSTVNPTNGASVNNLCHFIVSHIRPSRTPTIDLTFAKLIDRAKVWVLDIVSAMFALPAPKRMRLEDTPELTDDGVKSLIRSPYATSWNKMMAERNKNHEVYRTGLTAYRITPTLIAKRRSASEAENMEFVRRNTTIPVPQPHYPHLRRYMVMDFVEGRMLLECWDEQSAFMKFRIACTLRAYLSQLHRLTRSMPGTVSGGYVTGMLFENERYGPFDSPDRFKSWCDKIAHSGWVRYMKSTRQQGSARTVKPAPVIDDTWEPLVFGHQDLHLGNILLADDKSLWLIDWSYAGFFPRSMDSVILGCYTDAPKSWLRYRWFVAGLFPLSDQFWDYFTSDIHRYQPLTVNI